VIMFIDNIASLPFARLRLESRPIRFAIYRISNVLVVVGLNLYFLFVIYDPSIGIGYIFLAMLIANSLYLVFFFPLYMKWRPVFDREISSSMLSYSYPIVLTGLLGTTNEFFSRISLEAWLPEGFYKGRSSAFAVGVFGASYRFAVLMNLAVLAYRMAAEPFFFNNAADKESPKLFARVNHYFVIVCCFILLGIAINMDVLKHLMSPEYWEGTVVVVPLLLGYLFFGIYYNMTVWYKLTDKTIYGTYISVGGAVLTIALNYVFIPIYGYLGSAFVTSFVYLAMTITCYLLGQKYYPIPYPIFTDALYIIATTVLVYVVNLYEFSNLIVGASIHTIIILAWLGIVYLIERRESLHY
jgi:O-antigen/teichoic acid export membrane protein